VTKALPVVQRGRGNYKKDRKKDKEGNTEGKKEKRESL
jgi:hypothetical protein